MWSILKFKNLKSAFAKASNPNCFNFSTNIRGAIKKVEVPVSNFFKETKDRMFQNKNESV